MPWGDRTGPAGMGPMTGRAAGYCAGYSVPGYMNPIPGGGWYGRGYGRGYGYGWGRGRGWGWRAGAYPSYPPPAYGYPPYPYSPAPAPQEEAIALKEQAKLMEEDLKAIKKRIQDLESTAAKEK